MNNESGELIFLRYTYPVIGYCNKTKLSCCNKLESSEQEVLKFKEMLKYGGIPDRKRLEYLFPDAVRHLKSWGPEHVRDYWLGGEHNQIVEDNNLCKVYLLNVSEVFSPKNEEVSQVSPSTMRDTMLKSYLELKAGEFISMHAFQVAEKLSSDIIEHYKLNIKT